MQQEQEGKGEGRAAGKGRKKFALKGSLPHTADVIGQENWVTIRVWKSHVAGVESTAVKAAKASRQDDVESNVGHVSIETPRIYASFWPDTPPDGLKQKVPSHHMEEVKHDIASEDDKEPDVVVTLYSLYVNTLEAHYKDVKKRNTHWTLKGRTVFQDKANSCSGLARDLLRAGNIKALVEESISLKVITTPNAIAELVEKAKKRELILHKETNGYPQMMTTSKEIRETKEVGSSSAPASGSSSPMVSGGLTKKLAKYKALKSEVQTLKLELARKDGELNALRSASSSASLSTSMPYPSGPSYYQPMPAMYPGYGYPPSFWVPPPQQVGAVSIGSRPTGQSYPAPGSADDASEQGPTKSSKGT